MECIKFENTESGLIVPSYEDLMREDYEPNNPFKYEMKHYRRIALFFNVGKEIVCFSVNNANNKYFDFITIESDIRCFYDEPFTEENYNKGIEVLQKLLFKGK